VSGDGRVSVVVGAIVGVSVAVGVLVGVLVPSVVGVARFHIRCALPASHVVPFFRSTSCRQSGPGFSRWEPAAGVNQKSPCLSRPRPAQ